MYFILSIIGIVVSFVDLKPAENPEFLCSISQASDWLRRVTRLSARETN